MSANIDFWIQPGHQQHLADLRAEAAADRLAGEFVRAQRAHRAQRTAGRRHHLGRRVRRVLHLLAHA